LLAFASRHLLRWHLASPELSFASFASLSFGFAGICFASFASLAFGFAGIKLCWHLLRRN
jgi:hypothetical protein